MEQVDPVRRLVGLDRQDDRARVIRAGGSSRVSPTLTSAPVAIRLAEAGHEVLVIEAAPMIGGGSRSAELTLPGYLHTTSARR